MGGGGVGSGSGPGNTRGYFNADRTPVMIRNDYAANCGTYYTGFGYINTTYYDVHDGLFPDKSLRNGISFYRSEITMAEVRDGTTNTYMIGEKYLRPEAYSDGTFSNGEDEGAYNGFNEDTYRRAGPDFPPMQDRLGLLYPFAWGSAHAGVFNMAMCDGSVRAIGYAIDIATHEHLANRHDGEVIDASRL